MFHVEWLQSVLDELADLWTHADSALRAAITAATQRIDQVLQTDPFGQSESRPNNRRVVFASPLGITFRVEADQRTVTVLRVWLFRKR